MPIRVFLLFATLVGATVPALAGAAPVAPDVLAALDAGRPSVSAVVSTRAGRPHGSALAALAADPGARTFPALGMFAASLSADDLHTLARDPAVASIALDREVGALARRPARARPTRRGTASAGRPTGAGVGVALIDTGVNRAVVGGPVRAVSVVAGGAADDRHGHGTFLAELVREMAPRASIVSIRALDADGRGRVSDVLAAIDWLLVHGERHGVRVATFALATGAAPRCADDPLCHATRALHEAGILPVAAAGRAASGGLASPGRSPFALAVGGSVGRGTARRGDDRVADDSPRGVTRGAARPKPDLVAPIALRGYRGTSISAARVSASAALIADAAPSLDNDALSAVLLYTCQTLDGADMSAQGAGQVNLEGALTLARALERAGDDGRPGLDAARMPAPFTETAGELVPWAAGHVVVPGSMFVTRYTPSSGDLSGEIRREPALILAGGVLRVGRFRIGRVAERLERAPGRPRLRFTNESGQPVRIARTSPNAADPETAAAVESVRSSTPGEQPASVARRAVTDPYSERVGMSASRARSGEK